MYSPILLALAAFSLPAAAQQTPPTQGWPAARPADPPAKPPQGAPPPAAPKPPAAQAPGAPAALPPQTATGNPPPVPLPMWFVEIDVNKKGEVTRAEFLKYRMKSFDELDANKDGKLSIEEFTKVAEPPYSHDIPNGPSLEERRNRAKAEFNNLDTNRDGFVERAEAEALVHSEFNQYDTDRDNKVTEPEVRLIVQRSLAREQAERQQIEQRRRQGMAAVNDFIDMQLREADKLDKNSDAKVSQQEYISLAGPADGPQAQGLLPFDIRRQLVLRKFQEIDTNKDGQLDRVELTASAVKQFIEMDANHDRFLNEEEFKKAQENETKKMRAIIQAMQPAQPAPAPAQRPAPAPAQPRGGPPQQAPQGLAPGLPQGTR
ncbi:MAG: EF-hand domain-containing protein [Reyranellaceae bacterium]